MGKWLLLISIAIIIIGVPDDGSYQLLAIFVNCWQMSIKKICEFDCYRLQISVIINYTSDSLSKI